MAVAWGRGQRCWIVDRWSIEVSGERAVSPATHPEDWDLLKPIWSRAYPRAAAAGGDTQVTLLDADKFKGIVYSRLKRQDPGDSYIHLSRDLPDSVFLELTAESYIAGKWVKIRQRNESFDLLCYNLAAAYSVGLAQIDWDNPPVSRFAMFEGKPDAAPVPAPAPLRRKSRRSSFMGNRALR